MQENTLGCALGRMYLVNTDIRLDVAVVVRQTALVDGWRLAARCIPFVCVHMS